MREASIRHRTLLGLLGWLLAGPAGAATYGVPTNLDAAGLPTGSSALPPGWFNLDGLSGVFNNGDGVHQLRLFIEVTGDSLDIRVFDPGSNGARDIGTAGTMTVTAYSLLDPAGNLVASTTLGNDRTIGANPTDDRLVRLTPRCGGPPTASCGFYRIDSADPLNRDFSAASGTPISPGLYELRIATTSSTTETNMFGVDIRMAQGSAEHYNVFTLASDNSVSGVPQVTAFGETAWLAGAAPTANVTQPLMLHAFVDRGCTVQTSNYDGDLNNASGAGSSANIRDALGVTTALTVSNGTAHAENPVVVETTGATNLTAENYGMYLITNDIGPTQNNAVDWRVADFQNSTIVAASRPVQPVNPLRMYLPNGYAPATGNPNATAPAEPVLLTSARVVSGANPPVAGSVTRFFITTTFANETPNPASNVQITVGHQAGQSNHSAPYGCINGAGASGCEDASADTCADSSTGSYRRCTFATIPANSVASTSFEVDVTPPAPGLLNLTGPPAPLPNTTTTSAVFVPAYSSPSRLTETLGPLCNLVIDAGGTALATRATLRGLRASASRVEFAVSSDGHSVSFELYGTLDPTGRTGRVRLNAATIPAAHGSMAPAIHRVDVAETAPYLLLEELDSRGRRRLMGPFSTADTRLRAAFERIEARVGARDHGEPGRGRARWGRGRLQARDGDETRRGRSSRHVAAPRGIAVEVRAAGVVEIPLADLAAQGLRNAGRRLRVSHLGQGVPFRIVNTANGPSLTFDVDRLSTDFTGTNVYVVSPWDVPASVRLTRSEDPLDPGTTRVERNSLYVANAPEDADPWVWDLLFGDGSPWPYDWWGDPTLGEFDLPGLADGSGDVRARLRLLGRTDHEHTVEAFVNGVSLGSLTFQGAVPATLEGEVPLSTLRPVGNQLSVRYFGGEGEGLVYLGSLDLDIPIEPTRRTVPFELSPFDPALPRADGVTYLIVTHEAFRAQAEQLATLKRAEGHRAAVVDVERAYDRFSAGVFEARALRGLVRHFKRRGALRYVLLFGDDTFDPRDYSGLGATAFVPSLLGWDGEFGRVPSENLYADVDDDGKPDVAIGRLPVQTSEEASAVVDKIARQGALMGATRHLFAVDNQAPGDLPFRDLAESVASRLPAGATLAWADVQTGIGKARDDLRTGFGSAAVVHYFGHGGPEVWADEGLLSVEDVASLPGASPAPVLFAWTCEVQWFQYIFGPSIDEALLLKPSGGIVAGLGPVGISDPVLQRSLYERVYHHLLVRGSTLGEAVRRAKSEVLAANPAARPVVEGWSLIGDPSLRLSTRPEPRTGAPAPDGEPGSPSSSGRR